MGLYRSSVEHPHVLRLIALPWRQKPPELFSPLVLGCRALRRLKALRPALCRDSGGEVGKLLRLKCEDLIAGLGCLQGAARTLARRHERRCLDTIGVEIADDTGLDPERVLQRSDGILPPRL